MVGTTAVHGAVPARTRQAPCWARGCVVWAVAWNLVPLALDVSVAPEGAGRGPGTAFTAVGFAFFALVLVLHAARSRVIGTPQVRDRRQCAANPHDRVERGCRCGRIRFGLGIVCTAGRGAVVGAALARWEIRVPLSRSGQIAHAILAAARRHDGDR